MRDKILDERNKTHGDFKINAEVSQRIKKAIELGYLDKPMSAVHKEALHLIATKMSRIVSGHANFKDHWDDIAGYAKLGSEACD